MKIDPKLVAAARELRDRYLERANDPLLLSAQEPSGKYDVSRIQSAAEGSRQIAAPADGEHPPAAPVKALPRAA